jgi:NAD(P)-dependent dehydrogenase (short-subunit alcohol dehydrogenase family)
MPLPWEESVVELADSVVLVTGGVGGLGEAAVRRVAVAVARVRELGAFRYAVVATLSIAAQRLGPR